MLESSQIIFYNQIYFVIIISLFSVYIQLCGKLIILICLKSYPQYLKENRDVVLFTHGILDISNFGYHLFINSVLEISVLYLEYSFLYTLINQTFICIAFDVMKFPKCAL